jgi:hypothetical protein
MAETPGEQGERSSQERADELVAALEQRVGSFVRRGFAVAVETAEDIWAEAQSIRRRDRSSG